MRPLSASEAIGPALERTRDVLFRPFRWKTFLKIAAVAFFAEMGGFNSSSFSNGSGNTHSLPPGFVAFIVAFAVIIGLISLVIGLILLYIGSRLQLVLVELVATRQTYVSPMWRRVGTAVWRWIGFKLLFFLCILIVALPFTIPLILFFVHHGFSGGNPFTGLHIAEIVLFALAAFVALICVVVIYTLIRDLALPSVALEDVTVWEALRRLRGLIAAEPGQVALYVFLRLVLGIMFGIVAELGIVIVLLLSLIPPAIVGGILWAVLHKAGTAGTVALIALAIFAGIVFLCWAACVVISLIGGVLTFTQAYALYFLGGRYPLLGDLLDRSTPPPAYGYAAGYPPPFQPPPQAPATPPIAEPPPAS